MAHKKIERKKELARRRHRRAQRLKQRVKPRLPPRLRFLMRPAGPCRLEHFRGETALAAA